MVKAEANIKVFVGHLGCQVANVSKIQTESVVGQIYIRIKNKEMFLPAT